MIPEIKKGGIVILPGRSPGDTPKNKPAAIGVIIEKNGNEIKIKVSPATTLSLNNGDFVKIEVTHELKPEGVITNYN